MEENSLAKETSNKLVEIIEKFSDLNDNFLTDLQAYDTSLEIDQILKKIVDSLRIPEEHPEDEDKIDEELMEKSGEIIRNITKSIKNPKAEDLSTDEKKNLIEDNENTSQVDVQIISINHYKGEQYKVIIKNCGKLVENLLLKIVTNTKAVPLCSISSIHRSQTKEVFIQVPLGFLLESALIQFVLMKENTVFSVFSFFLLEIENVLPIENGKFQIKIKNNLPVTIECDIVMIQEAAYILKHVVVPYNNSKIFICDEYKPASFMLWRKDRYISNTYT